MYFMDTVLHFCLISGALKVIASGRHQNNLTVRMEDGAHGQDLDPVLEHVEEEYAPGADSATIHREYLRHLGTCRRLFSSTQGA